MNDFAEPAATQHPLHITVLGVEDRVAFIEAICTFIEEHGDDSRLAVTERQAAGSKGESATGSALLLSIASSKPANSANPANPEDGRQLTFIRRSDEALSTLRDTMQLLDG